MTVRVGLVQLRTPATHAAALADMEDEEYQRFVCIEPAQLTPVQLEPGAAWEGRYRVS